MRPGDHVTGDDLPDLGGVPDAGFDRGLHGGDVAPHDRRHVPAPVFS